MKDANDLLKAGKIKEITTACWQARPYRPDGIVSLSDISERVLADVEMGAPWFLPGLTAATFGRRLGDVIGIGAGTGVGKSDFVLEQVAYDLDVLKVRTGVLMLEQGVAETGRRLAGKMASRRFHIPDGSWTRDELEAAWASLQGNDLLHLYDNWGVTDWKTIASKVRYMNEALGCTHIYLDHLTALAAAETDERKALEQIMAEVAGMAQGKFVFHYVSHLATPEGKPHEEGGRVMIRHFKGSRALGFWSHFMLGLERNQQAADESERHATVLRVLKDRFTGRSTGMTWRLGYDDKTGRVSEASTAAFDGGLDEF
jgi:twinkle protein